MHERMLRPSPRLALFLQESAPTMRGATTSPVVNMSLRSERLSDQLIVGQGNLLVQPDLRGE